MKRLLMIMLLAGGAMLAAPQLQSSAEAAVYRYRSGYGGGYYGGGYYGGRSYYGGRGGYYGNPYRGNSFNRGYYGGNRGFYGGNRGFYGGRGTYLGGRNFGVFIR